MVQIMPERGRGVKLGGNAAASRDMTHHPGLRRRVTGYAAPFQDMAHIQGFDAAQLDMLQSLWIWRNVLGYEAICRCMSQHPGVCCNVWGYAASSRDTPRCLQIWAVSLDIRRTSAPYALAVRYGTACSRRPPEGETRNDAALLSPAPDSPHGPCGLRGRGALREGGSPEGGRSVRAGPLDGAAARDGAPGAGAHRHPGGGDRAGRRAACGEALR